MRVIQAGVGGFGQSWLYAVKECDGFEHVAIVDTSPAALHQAGEITGLDETRQFRTIQDALAAVQADGFLDITPAPLHRATSTAAIDAGLHVLVEKPISDTMAGARALVEAALAKKRTLMVTQQYRYQDQARAVRRLIADGTIGEVDHMLVEFQIQGVFAGWRQRMAHPFLMDMAVHHFDMIRYLLKQNGRQVFAQTWNPTVSNTTGDASAFALIEMENGVRINYTGGFASPGTDTGWNGRWTITGRTGSIVWNQKDEWGPIRIFRQPANPADYHEMHFFTPLPEVWGEPHWAESMGPTGHHFDLYHWRACIEQGQEPETSGRDNLNTLALVLAAMRSADTHQTVEVAQVLNG